MYVSQEYNSTGYKLSADEEPNAADDQMSGSVF